MAANFMDSFMKGYAFMDKIEDNNRRREREDYTFDRLKIADTRSDKIQTAKDAQEWLANWRMGSDGIDMTDEQLAADPKKRAQFAEFSNLDIFSNVRNQGLPKGTTSTIEEIVPNPNGSITPVMTQHDNKGVAISTGPATYDRKTKKEDPKSQSIITQLSFTESINKLTSELASQVPGGAAAESARRQKGAYRRTLDELRSAQGELTTPTTQPPTGITTVPSTPGTQPPAGTTAPVTTTAPTQPIGIQPQEAVVDSDSLLERAKPKKSVPVGTPGRKVGEALFSGHKKNTVSIFRQAADSKSPNSDNQLTMILRDPKRSGNMLLNNLSAVEKEIGVQKTQEMLTIIKDKLGDEDSALAKDLSNMQSVTSTVSGLTPGAKKNAIATEKGLSALSKKEQDSLVIKEANTITQLRPGRSAKAQGKTRKRIHDAIVRLHKLRPDIVTFEMMERGLRSKDGRMTKADIKWISDGMGGATGVDTEGRVVGRIRNKDKIAIERYKAQSKNVLNANKARDRASKAQRQIFDDFASSFNPPWANVGDKTKYGPKKVNDAIVSDMYATIYANGGKMVRDLGISPDPETWTRAQTHLFQRAYENTRKNDKRDNAWFGNNGIDTRGEINVPGAGRSGGSQGGIVTRKDTGNRVDINAEAKRMGVTADQLRSAMKAQGLI